MRYPVRVLHFCRIWLYITFIACARSKQVFLFYLFGEMVKAFRAFFPLAPCTHWMEDGEQKEDSTLPYLCSFY